MNEKGNIKKTIQFKKEYDDLMTKLYKGLDLERQDINNLIIGAGINQIVENVKILGINEYEKQQLKKEMVEKLQLLKEQK